MADHRRATAERNATALLDAIERLLERGAPSTVAAVAAEAGVSRVTFYAHFASRGELLEAVVERALGQAVEALAEARLDEGPPAEALDRTIARCWAHLERFEAINRAASEGLSPQAMQRTHEGARVPLGRLLERGRRAGDFHTGAPVEFQVTVILAVMHAARDEIRAGRLDADAALAAVTATLRGALVTRR